MADADWIAADFGDTALRAWAISASGDVVASAVAPAAVRDIAALAPFAADWLSDGAGGVVVASGVAQPGAARPVPCAPLPERLSLAGGLPLVARAIPGLRQASPPGLTRGEETRIAGYLAKRPDFDGVLCLTGAQSIWAQISAGEVVSFQAALTGRLLLALADGSVPAANGDVFLGAVAGTLSRPEGLAARLAGIVAAAEMGDEMPDGPTAHLAGALIGAELAAARPYWLGQDVVVIGEAGRAALYRDALAAQGVPPVVEDEVAMTLAGLVTAHARFAAGG